MLGLGPTLEIGWDRSEGRISIIAIDMTETAQTFGSKSKFGPKGDSSLIIVEYLQDVGVAIHPPLAGDEEDLVRFVHVLFFSEPARYRTFCGGWSAPTPCGSS